jgi:hypothetical protein
MGERPSVQRQEKRACYRQKERGLTDKRIEPYCGQEERVLRQTEKSEVAWQTKGKSPTVERWRGSPWQIEGVGPAADYRGILLAGSEGLIVLQT